MGKTSSKDTKTARKTLTAVPLENLQLLNTQKPGETLAVLSEQRVIGVCRVGKSPKVALGDGYTELAIKLILSDGPECNAQVIVANLAGVSNPERLEALAYGIGSWLNAESLTIVETVEGENIVPAVPFVFKSTDLSPGAEPGKAVH